MSQNPNAKISVVIPCYGSENSIEKVVFELKETFIKNNHTNYEILLICDDSPDNVYSVIKRLAKADKKIRGACLSKNFGQHAALMLGYRKSSGDIVVSADDDGETPAGEIFSLINGIDEQTDVVYASYPKTTHGLFRDLGTRVNRTMARSLVNLPKHIEPSSFFAMKRFVVDEIIKYENPYPYVLGLVLRTTSRLKNVAVAHRSRITGKSGYSVRKLFRLWLNGFSSFSIKPLRFATICGMLLAVFGFISTIYIIINKLCNPNLEMGWSSTMATLIFIGGMIMLMLGIIGEYIGRQYICINHAPQYVVREDTAKDDHE